MDFSGKNVWVTGAGKGIGYATALAFVEAGAKVTGFDQAFTQEQYPFATEVMDVADAAQVAQVCQRLLAETERLDALVNAAGILRMGATDQLSKEDWQQTFAVNVGGAFNLFQQTMNQFRRQRGGAIVTVASDAAHTPRIGMSAYGASKAALKSLALSVGLELAGSGVRCNVVSAFRWGKSPVHKRSPTRFCSSPLTSPAILPYRILWSMAAQRWGHKHDLETPFNARRTERHQR